jgi:hypothetical protein
MPGVQRRSDLSASRETRLRSQQRNFRRRICAQTYQAMFSERVLEATGDHSKAALLCMNSARKLLILLESKISSLRGAKRRGNRRCLEYTFGNGRLDWTLVLEAIGDRHVAALLAMTRESRFMVTPKFAFLHTQDSR